MASSHCTEFVARLCTQCALCCNGVLFKDVELQPGDDAEALRLRGIPVRNGRTEKFPQPCAALEGCRCEIYAERPARCRQFDCALLQAVAAGETSVATALSAIRETRRRAEQVQRLLRELGDADEARPLSLRFRRVKRRVEAGEIDEAGVDTFGELTLAVHDLNLLLRGKFYP